MAVLLWTRLFFSPFICSLFSFLALSPGREEAVAALKDGEEQLKMLQRQATISQLYPSARSVME